MRWGAATRRAGPREEGLTRNAGGDGSRGKDGGVEVGGGACNEGDTEVNSHAEAELS